MNFFVNSTKVSDKIFVDKVKYNIIFRSSLNEEFEKKLILKLKNSKI